MCECHSSLLKISLPWGDENNIPSHLGGRNLKLHESYLYVHIEAYCIGRNVQDRKSRNWNRRPSIVICASLIPSIIRNEITLILHNSFKKI